MNPRSLVLVAISFGCAAERQAAWEAKTPPPGQPAGQPTKGAPAVADDPFTKAVAEGEALFAERGDRDKLTKAIYAWEKAAQIKPDWQVYARLSRAAYFLADGHLSFELDNEEAKKKYEETFEKGITWGEQAMVSYSPEFAAKVKAGTRVEDAVNLINKDGVPAMYWYDVNLGKWANAKGFATRLANKDRIKKIMERCLQLDPDYFWGAPLRYFGAFYAIAPAFAGGDLDKSNKFFTDAATKYPHYFATHVLIAEFYAVKRQDRALFERELKYVLETKEDVIPELVPEQRAEKRKAERLLKQIDERF